MKARSLQVAAIVAGSFLASPAMSGDCASLIGSSPFTLVCNPTSPCTGCSEHVSMFDFGPPVGVKYYKYCACGANGSEMACCHGVQLLDGPNGAPVGRAGKGSCDAPCPGTSTICGFDGDFASCFH
jgi:hypothetical protein